MIEKINSLETLVNSIYFDVDKMNESLMLKSNNIEQNKISTNQISKHNLLSDNGCNFEEV